MAIVDLGTISLVTGANPVAFAPFRYQRNRAYIINAIMTSINFDQVFSYVRIMPYIMPNNQLPFLLNEITELDIVQTNQSFYFAASTLFDQNGDVELRAQRLPRWRGAGDGSVMLLQLTYDDALDTGTWR